MESIYIIGDTHTVNAFRIAGVDGISSEPEDAETALDEILKKEDAVVVVITSVCAAQIEARIKSINLESGKTTVIKIPGIDDESGFGSSLMNFITEALGVAL